MSTTVTSSTYRNPLLRFFAHFFSIVFHPIFIASYVMAFLVWVHPFLFSAFDPRMKFFRFISVFFSATFLPLFAVFLVWRLGFVKSMLLPTSRDRLIPYAIVMIFYFWIWYVFRNQGENPVEATRFLLGSFLSICFAWMANIFFKISMHAVAMGGLVMFFFLFTFHDPYGSGLYLSATVLIAGLVCTARLIISDHSDWELYSGLFAGALAQLIAWQF